LEGSQNVGFSPLATRNFIGRRSDRSHEKGIFRIGAPRPENFRSGPPPACCPFRASLKLPLSELLFPELSRAGLVKAGLVKAGLVKAGSLKPLELVA
jgi:hypothetical protein